MQKIQDIVIVLSRLWKLNNLRPLAEGRLVNNYLCIAYSAEYNCDVVLKILLWHDARKYEAAALRYFDGHGCVELLAYNAEHHALLLPYLRPGETLRSLFPEHDEAATHILVKIIKQLHACTYTAKDAALFPTVAEWIKALDNTYAHIPEQLLSNARTLAKHLLSKKSAEYLLHGDLHHENIVRAGADWVSIDPKGVVGEAEYEFGAFIRNPIPDLILQNDVQRIIKKRIELCSQLSGYDAQRIADWAFVQAVLSACWVHEKGNEHLMNYFITCADVLQKL